MKRLQVERWTGQLLNSNSRSCCLRQRGLQASAVRTRLQSQVAAKSGTWNSIDEVAYEDITQEASSLPSPPPQAALQSAKLAALHARLSLPKKLPLQTLSRTLVDTTADPSPSFNNGSLAQIGASLISHQVTEWLTVTYPRLPMTVMYAAVKAYGGPSTLSKVGFEWGVESAAYPGGEVDPGLLQFQKLAPGTAVGTSAAQRPGPSWYRRGVSSRVVYDDEFGDVKAAEEGEDATPQQKATDQAYAQFVRALVGSIYVHAGSKAAKTFVHAYILSRHLDISKLFYLKTPTRDLSRLCSREDFEHPVARLLSETGRLSRHPVFVVGIFSGTDKLGEGSAPSLYEARLRAAVSALKAWYLYSPTAGRTGRLPSDVDDGGAWEPVHIDMGEIV